MKTSNEHGANVDARVGPSSGEHSVPRHVNVPLTVDGVVTARECGKTTVNVSFVGISSTHVTPTPEEVKTKEVREEAKESGTRETVNHNRLG